VDAQAGEAEVVPHRVVGMNGAKSSGDLPCSAQVCLLPRGEAECQREFVHVRINRDEQFRPWDIAPAAGVNIVGPDHPPQKQMQPFACTSQLGRGQETLGSPVEHLRKLLHKERERRNYVLIPVVQTRDKACVQRAVIPEDSLDAEQHGTQLVSGGKPVLEVTELGRQSCSGRPPEVLVRRSHPVEDDLHALQDLAHIAVCQGRRDDANDLTIADIVVMIKKLQRVRMHEFPPVAPLVELAELFFIHLRHQLW